MGAILATLPFLLLWHSFHSELGQREKNRVVEILYMIVPSAAAVDSEGASEATSGAASEEASDGAASAGGSLSRFKQV